MLGRLIGLTFLLPYMAFLILRRLSSRLTWQLAAVFILIAAQGALGWYMVQSGLQDRVDVSQYRLSAHLVLASFLLAAVIWIALGLGKNRSWRRGSGQAGALLILGLIFLQIAAGGFVAGLDAGMGYNTWPKMDGRWLPQGLFIMQPKMLNLFENAMTVQFNHRVIAYVVLLVALVHAWRTFSMSGAILVYALLVQMALGIFTLISHVQIALALSHQAGAMIVLALAIWHLHRKSLERSGALAPAVV
jgi:cytochrome c oxidase assembly protein subunit 15